jgi:hypothetical protein
VSSWGSGSVGIQNFEGPGLNGSYRVGIFSLLGVLLWSETARKDAVLPGRQTRRGRVRPAIAFPDCRLCSLSAFVGVLVNRPDMDTWLKGFLMLPSLGNGRQSHDYFCAAAGWLGRVLQAVEFWFR